MCEIKDLENKINKLADLAKVWETICSNYGERIDLWAIDSESIYGIYIQLGKGLELIRNISNDTYIVDFEWDDGIIWVSVKYNGIKFCQSFTKDELKKFKNAYDYYNEINLEDLENE